MTTATAADWMLELFGEWTPEKAAADARTAQAAAEAEAARLAKMKTDKTENACPKCAGTGYLPQFQHRKGGECFLCGASGVFRRHK
jgi:hypothetical protein